MVMVLGIVVFTERRAMEFLSQPEVALVAFLGDHPDRRAEVTPEARLAFSLYGQLKLLEQVPNSLLGLAFEELSSFVLTFLRNQDLTSVVDLYNEVLEREGERRTPVFMPIKLPR